MIMRNYCSTCGAMMTGPKCKRCHKRGVNANLVAGVALFFIGVAVLLFASLLVAPFAHAQFNPMTVNGLPNVTPLNCSGVITTGGTAQNAHAASPVLHGMTISNLDTSEVMWFSFTGTAAASTIGSYALPPATATTFAGIASYTTPLGFGYNTALSVIAATTNHKFSCTRW